MREIGVDIRTGVGTMGSKVERGGLAGRRVPLV